MQQHNPSEGYEALWVQCPGVLLLDALQEASGLVFSQALGVLGCSFKELPP